MNQQQPFPAGDVSGPMARYWHTIDDGRVQCMLCPRECRLREGQRGFCFVRGRKGDELVLTTYGRSSGFCIDPIEKKPLAHAYPGTSVFSFGTAGCNLGCRFCQNWDISTSRRMDRLQDEASPEAIARAAAEAGCRSVAVTYNDPVIFAEYAIDVAQACRERGLATVAVTAGYVQGRGRIDLFEVMDAANVDLKAFNDEVYVRLTGGHVSTVLDTLVHLRSTGVWTEITTLLIPGHNDDDPQLRAMCAWIATELGPDVPLHFSAFHPDHRMPEVPRTPLSTQLRARQIALDAGLQFVYTGNVHHRDGDRTRCPGCGETLIERDRYTLLSYRLTADGACPRCATRLPGLYDREPGDFGPRRIPVRLQPH